MTVLSERFLSFAAMAVPQSEATAAAERILARIAPKRFHRSNGALDLTRIYEVDPPPGGAHLHSLLIYTPRQLPGLSVLVTNIRDGWNSLCYLLAKEHGQLVLQVRSTRDHVEWPIHCIQVWNNGESVRYVRTMREDSGRWEFFQKGNPQSFEDPARYQRGIIRRRLDRQAIIEYLHRIGWDIAKPSFWESDDEATCFDETSKRQVVYSIT